MPEQRGAIAGAGSIPSIGEVDPSLTLSQIEAIWELARVLYETMEHLNPGVESPEWEDLSDGSRWLYHLCVKELLTRDRLVRLVLQI